MCDTVREIIVRKPYDRVEIHSNDALLILPRRVFRQNKIREGEALTKEYIDWANEAQMEACWDTSLYYITSRMRTAKQIEDYLGKKGYHDEAVRNTLDKLKDYGYVNDAFFADMTVKGKGKGKMRLRQELKQKGVDEDIIEQSLDMIDEDSQRETALDYAKKALARAKEGEDPRKTRKRMADALARRGYEWDLIASVIDGLLDDDI